MNPTYLIYTAIVLVAIGTALVLTRKSLLFILIGIELILNAVNLNLVAFNHLHPQNVNGQTTTLFIMAIAICETACGVAIMIQVARQYKTITPSSIQDLKEQA